MVVENEFLEMDESFDLSDEIKDLASLKSMIEKMHKSVKYVNDTPDGRYMLYKVRGWRTRQWIKGMYEDEVWLWKIGTMFVDKNLNEIKNWNFEFRTVYLMVPKDNPWIVQYLKKDDRYTFYSYRLINWWTRWWIREKYEAQIWKRKDGTEFVDENWEEIKKDRFERWELVYLKTPRYIPWVIYDLGDDAKWKWKLYCYQFSKKWWTRRSIRDRYEAQICKRKEDIEFVDKNWEEIKNDRFDGCDVVYFVVPEKISFNSLKNLEPEDGEYGRIVSMVLKRLDRKEITPQFVNTLVNTYLNSISSYKDSLLEELSPLVDCLDAKTAEKIVDLSANIGGKKLNVEKLFNKLDSKHKDVYYTKLFRWRSWLLRGVKRGERYTTNQISDRWLNYIFENPLSSDTYGKLRKFLEEINEDWKRIGNAGDVSKKVIEQFYNNKKIDWSQRLELLMVAWIDSHVKMYNRG